ncbi:MAG: 2-C-methyl-D-erythritol 2,4-cyclodiphosphate synthase [Clostridia bacterium]|nr:2-C-methyl-D-erythritol 2,4-cyclodiphosphate synthase [Clostridia bacterium]
MHRLVKNRKLFLGCIEIQHELGLLGHSDADVLCHAIADAMLGACGLGDIGVHFPDSDDSYSGVSGEFILKKTLEICVRSGFHVSNIDSIIVAQKPKLSPYISQMKTKIASALGINEDRVNVKATTEEKLGFTGAEEGISAHAVCIMIK